MKSAIGEDHSYPRGQVKWRTPGNPGTVLQRQYVFLAIFLLLTRALGLAQIDRLKLGARFSDDRQLTFRVFSSRATRIELCLYGKPFGADEVAHVPLDKDPNSSVWTLSLPLSRIRGDFGVKGHDLLRLSCVGSQLDFRSQLDEGQQSRIHHLRGL